MSSMGFNEKAFMDAKRRITECIAYENYTDIPKLIGYVIASGFSGKELEDFVSRCVGAISRDKMLMQQELEQLNSEINGKMMRVRSKTEPKETHEETGTPPKMIMTEHIVA